MTGGQTAIGLAAAALVVANQVEHKPLKLTAVLGNSTHTTGTVFGQGRTQLEELGLEVVAVIVLVVVAGVSSTGAKLAGVVVAALWILFLMKATAAKAATPLHQGASVNGSRSSSQAVAA
jgi:hypothetical protein